MATASQRLASSVDQLAILQRGGRRVFRSRELGRVHRERLIANGFLTEVVRGWLMATNPASGPHDSTPWYASYWEFCGSYCTERFGTHWHLSPEQSLLLHAENAAVPRQTVVYAIGGTNNSVALPFDTSLYDLRQDSMPPEADLTEREGLRVYTPEAALLKAGSSFLARHPVEARVVLAGVPDASDLLRRMLEGGKSTVAGWLAGAFRAAGHDDVADDIVGSMKSAGYDVRESNPLDSVGQVGSSHLIPAEAPVARRLQLLWNRSRQAVLDAFPSAPGLPDDRSAYLACLDEHYRSDAYHSLSIEGYQVTPELVERVRTGAWDPDSDADDRQSRDGLAARGYWQAFQSVRSTVEEILSGSNPVEVVRSAHRDWYRELFEPSVAAGLVPATALAGYRSDAVFLRGSRHVPPRKEAVRDAMPTLFDLMLSESEPAVRAVLGHWLFGYIHPYPDGNGRVARFLMNVMFASGGYPWTVVPVTERAAYMAALESASVDSDIRPFARFLAGLLGQAE